MIQILEKKEPLSSVPGGTLKVFDTKGKIWYISEDCEVLINGGRINEAH